eukprot:PITA_27335
MVLVQQDEFESEHVIYYLSWTLTPTELKYSHVEKLALAIVPDVQRFLHYILLRKTIVISDSNPMQYILTKQLLGGTYSKWIVILQEFDLQFEKAKSKKSLVFVELMCDFPRADIEHVAEDVSTLLIHGMEISLSISRPNLFGQPFHDLSAGKYDSNPNLTLLLEIIFIVVGWILFPVVALLMTRLRRFLMTATLERVAVICLVLWAYRTSIKTSTSFTPFQLVYGLEAVLPIECEISSLQIVVQLLPATFEEEKRLLYLAQLDENRCNAALVVKTHAKRIKAQYGRNVTPLNFLEGNLVLLYDQANDKLGAGKFVPMWHGLYIVKRKLAKWAYDLEDFDGVSLGKPRNGLYLK